MTCRETGMYSPEWWEKLANIAETVAASADAFYEESLDMNESMKEFKRSMAYPSSRLLCALFRIASELKEIEIAELKRMFPIEWESMHGEERIESWKPREDEESYDCDNED